ncbi:hypothetical protein HUJ05_012557 [Dendroctonus ponderosae]|nr:hypothetical protein HUJ05_012557 [Dendroctonus ponderosae]
MKTLIEKCVEYNQPLALIFVDFEKAFDTIDQSKMLEVLTECRIDHRYITLIKNIYAGATARVKLHKYTNKFPIRRGVGWSGPPSFVSSGPSSPGLSDSNSKESSEMSSSIISGDGYKKQ